MLMFEDLIRTKSSHMQNKRAHAHTCTVAHRRINSFIYTQICCYSSAVLWAPQRLWWCEKALEVPTGLLPNGRVDIYPRWLWLLLRQKWFNLLCWIQRNLFWWMERATAKEPEMHVCARCTLIYQRTASGATVTCFIWSLCWQWSRIVHEVSSRHVSLNHTYRRTTPPEGSTMSISEPSASTPDQTWLNPTLVLTVTHCSDIFIFSVKQLYNRMSASPYCAVEKLTSPTLSTFKTRNPTLILWGKISMWRSW